jgi:protein-tyrosine phosphatase
MPNHPERRLAWDACLNIRDLGGYPAGPGRTRWRAMLRGDTLTRLSESGCVSLWEYGVRTVIDLRSSHEVAAAPHPATAGGRQSAPGYQLIPLLDEYDAEGAAQIAAIRTLAELYEIILSRYGDRIAAVMRAIAEAPPGGVLFHCHAGKDRTGLIAMFLLAIAGVPEEIIVGDYAVSERHLEPLHREIVARYAHDPEEQRRVADLLNTRPDWMQMTLTLLAERHGGPLAYLAAVGLTDRELATLRARLVEE